MTERESLICTISDMSKDAYGFRVRHDWSSMSDEDLQAEYEYFLRASQEAVDRERQEQQEAIAAHDRQIEKMMADYGITRETAIRWDMEAHDTKDPEEYRWMKNLPYSNPLYQ